MNIAVYAASATDIAGEYFEAARRLGELIALKGCTLVDGGGAAGLMGAVNDGCLQAGGRAVGVIPRFMSERGWGHQGLSQIIVTDGMHSRKQTMADMASAVIALPGGVGTFEEMLEIITWRKLGLFAGPAVFVNTKGYYDPMAAMLRKAESEGFMSARPPLYSVADTPDAAIEQIFAALP